jgi:hypothetical protein
MIVVHLPAQLLVETQGVSKLSPALSWSHHPPGLSLPSASDYRHEPHCLAENEGFLFLVFLTCLPHSKHKEISLPVNIFEKKNIYIFLLIDEIKE